MAIKIILLLAFFAGLIVVGFFTAITGLVSEDAARAAIRDTVPPSTTALNLRAFELGFSHGHALLSRR